VTSVFGRKPIPITENTGASPGRSVGDVDAGADDGAIEATTTIARTAAAAAALMR
jgi:hypothetical protein